MFDVLVVGSGVSGVGATLGLLKRDLKVGMLDVGIECHSRLRVDQNLYDYREQSDAFELMIGHEHEGLYNLRRGVKYMPARLTSPGFSFVVKDADRLQPVVEQGFSAVQSFARGGLANAWGAGAFRYTERELQGYPISLEDLDPYYDEITDEMGISGADDDLTPYFGSTKHIQPPLRMSVNAQKIYSRYLKRRDYFRSRGIHMGRPRFAILSEQRGDRCGLRYQNLEFWQPYLPEIYTPAYTLDRLQRSGKLSYLDGQLVQRWRKSGDKIIVTARCLKTGNAKEHECQKLVLAAGTINTARIVLSSNSDFATKLPLLDNPSLQIPVVLPGHIGTKLERYSFGAAHLNAIYDQGWGPHPLQGSYLDISSPARAEFFDKFPLSASANMKLIRYLLPSMMINLVFFPSDNHMGCSLRLNSDQSLEIDGGAIEISDKLIQRLVRVSISLGAWSHRHLVVRVPKGGGLHYAGTLPMRVNPRGRYECSANGELNEAPGVFIADGACLPRLPAKNHSLTLMANAKRIGHHVAKKFT